MIATLQSQPARHFIIWKGSPRGSKKKLHGSKRSVERMLSMCNAVLMVDERSKAFAMFKKRSENSSCFGRYMDR